VRFPASSGDLLYDPTLELILTPGDKDEFWRHPWFVWSAGSLGVLVRASALFVVVACGKTWPAV